MINIKIDRRILAVCPNIQIGLLSANVVNCDTSDALWQEIEDECSRIASTYQLLEINQRPAIAATRKLYKSLGKDPGRYRVSSEALCRRIIRGLGLYRLTSLIDIVNLVSVRSGYAISGLDADKLVGDTLTMGVGEKDEQYCAIGRGLLNIEGLPVYRDAQGGVATPTSDEERTKFTLDTTSVQININAFAPEMPVDEALTWTASLLEKYAQATNIETKIITEF
jgi:DNA/RNA-binding domain of Phe-tRNA-synthetase-like protein